MLNLVYALLAGACCSLILFIPHLLKFGEALVPGILVWVITYIILARRTFKSAEKQIREALNCLQARPNQLEPALKMLKKTYPLAKWQIGIKSQIDTQIGMLYFLHKEFHLALPYLSKATYFGHWFAEAMLAVIYYKQKDYGKMRKTLSIMTKKAKKQSFPWALSAYLLQQIQATPEALQFLNAGLKKNPNNPELKENLLCLQNNKKMKMRVYKEQWYQLHLERPPLHYAPQNQQYLQQQQNKASRLARRGRW